MKNKTNIVLILILAAFAIWALSTMKPGTNGGLQFFAGGDTNEGVIRYYAFHDGCTTDTQCKDIALSQGAPTDVIVSCKEKVCYAKTVIEVKTE